MKALSLVKLFFMGAALAGQLYFARASSDQPHIVTSHVPPRHEYLGRLWTSADGLPLNYIQAITQTHDGFLWIGTRAGVARFDGQRFTVFTSANTPAFKSHNCLSLKEGPDGTLWIGTVDGVVRYANREFTSISVPYFHPAGRWVPGIAISPSGEVWLATRRGPGRISGNEFISDETYPSYRYPGSKSLARECESIGFDREGTLFVSDQLGLMRKRGEQWERIEKKRALAMFNASDGELWLAGPELGDFENGKPVFTRLTSGNLAVRAATADPRGGIWAADKTNLYRFDRRFQQVLFTPDVPGEINAICADREGNIWLGTSDGVLQLTKKLFRAYTPAQGMPSADVWSISQAPDGSIWAGTHGGLARINSNLVESWIWDTVPGLPPGTAERILATRSGELWCNLRGYLWKSGQGTGGHFMLDENKSPRAGRPIYEEADGTVWTADFLKAIRWKDDSILQVLSVEGGCLGMLRDSAGRLWVGTGGEGVLIFGNGTTNHLRLENGLVGDHCRPVLAETNGAVWIASNKGLNRWKNGELKSFSIRDGFPEDYVLNLLEDDFGWFWLNGHRGIYRVEKRALNEYADGAARRISYVAYSEANGLPSVEGNGGELPNSFKARDGQLWFPTIKGIAVVNPADAHNPAEPALPIVTSIHIDRELVLGDRKGFSNSIPELRFGPGRGHVVRIEFTAPSFTPSLSSRCFYRLEPEDTEWIEAQGERYAIYTNLKPGAYRFRLKAFNADNIPAEAAPIALVFAPHFYRTIPFYLAVAISLAALAGGIHLRKLQVQRTILRLEQQNALQQERSRIAADIHDALGADLSRIALLSERIRRGGAVNEDAAGISETIRTMGTNMSELIWATNARNDTLDNLVSYIRAHAADQCESAGLKLTARIGEVPPRPVSGLVRHHVYLIFREALTNVLKHARASEVRLKIQLVENTFEMGVEDNGSGFKPDLAARGNGHLNLRQRSAQIGADLQVTAGPNGQGTSVRLRVPLAEGAGQTPVTGPEILGRPPSAT